MTSPTSLSPAGAPLPDPDKIENPGVLIQLGYWYWTKMFGADKHERLACVTQLGSNFVELSDPYEHSRRYHLNEFEKECRRELDPEKYIKEKTVFYQNEVAKALAEIQAITARLGVGRRAEIGQGLQEASSRGLAVLSGTDDVKTYKKSLVKAKDKELPALFKEVEEASKDLVIWMKAQALPMKGLVGEMEGCIGQIEDRIFNVSLYAGLTEEVEQISNGAPAKASERLRILQRLTFMDEECLIDYKHGGIDIKKLGDFDKWLADPKHRDRILPFPRCMVAFRVRRNRKERDCGGSLQQAFINMDLAEADKLTFLYIRNGDQLYRMSCEMEFGDLIFPGIDELNLNEPMMAKVSGNDEVDEVITSRHYDDLMKEAVGHEDERKAKCAQWKKENPRKRNASNPHFQDWPDHTIERLKEYEPFSPESVYYDEIKGELESRVKYYNRIAIIVQGLYDRSSVLHPHPPVRLYDPDGFAQAIELIYADHALYHGEAPDFDAYRKECNASLEVGSLTIGQRSAWGRKEADKENRRLSNSWRNKSEYRHTEFHPYGNPGPNYIEKIFDWHPRKRRAVFVWNRQRLKADRWKGQGKGQGIGDPMPTSITVLESALFNVSAYKPGDYRRFFMDPRTREQYLKWAPLLIAAEEFHAGNLDAEFGHLKDKNKNKGRAGKNYGKLS